ncbi:MAG TPA: MFS transporter, partial [Nitrososphaerales archaeon]|nr:MFS transporter [Nitrososphaerales archaeon]
MEESRSSLIATSLGHFINDGLTGVLPLMYPVFVASYGLSLQTISVLAFLQSAFSIFVSPLVGRISDARGNFGTMIALGLVLFAVGTGGYAVSALFSGGTVLLILLLVFTFMIGVGSSFYHPLGATVLRAKWRAQDLGGALGINGSAGSVGRIAMPVAAAVLIAGVSLASTGVLAILSIAGALAILGILARMKFTATRVEASGNFIRSMLPPRRLASKLSSLTVVSFSRGLFTGVLPFIPLYLTQVDNYSTLQAGFLYSATLGMGIPSTIIFGFLQDRIGAKSSITISNMGGLISLFGFALGQNPGVVEAALLLFGFFSYSAFSLLLGMVHDLTQYGEMTSGGALVWGVGNTGGSAVAPLLVGLLALPSFFGSLTAG